MGALLGSFFLNPLFLIGVGTAGIPVVIHMLYRKKAPRVLFSTIRFLKLSVENTAHRQRLTDLLLLLMRSLLFALLAIALSKPFVRPGALFSGSSANTNVVLVIDNSYSMGCLHEGATRYALAKQAAQQIIKDLGERNKAALVFTCGRESRSSAAADDDANGAAWAKYSTLSTHLDDIFEAVGSSQVSNERANILASLKKAFDILAESSDPNKEIYVLTDMQRLSWERAGRGRELKKLASSRIPIIVVDCGRKDYRNLSITDVAVRAKGLAVGVPVMIEAKVLNASNSAQSTVVSLHVRGEKRQWRSLDIEPGATAVVSFNYVFKEAGPQTGQVILESDDSLQTDNVRNFKADVVERIKVLVVSETRSAISFLNEGFYLANALDPFRDQPEETKSVINPVECTRAEMLQRRLGDYAVVFLLNLPKFSTGQAQTLAKYVADGGHVVIFPGNLVVPSEYHRSLLELKGLIADNGGLLPAKLEPAQGDEKQRTECACLADVDKSHRIFESFRNMSTSFFEKVKVYKWIPMVVPHGSPTEVLATLDNGQPFLVEKAFGRGRVLMCCTAATGDWSSLPVTKFFLPMVHQIVYYLTSKHEASGEYVAGSPVRFILPRRGIDLTVAITDPVGRVRQLKSNPKSEATVMVYDDTYATGVYYCRPDKEIGSIRTGVFVVNPNPAEGELASMPNEEAKSLLPSDRVYFASSVDDLAKVINRIREGFQLWNFLLYIVLGIAIFECFLANKKRPETGVKMVRYGARAKAS